MNSMTRLHLGEAARMVPVRMSTAKSNQYSKSWRDVHHTAPYEFASLCLTGAECWEAMWTNEQ